MIKKINNKDINALKKERKMTLILALSIFFISTILLIFLLLFETREMKIYVDIFGTIFGVISYFLFCYFLFFKFSKIKYQIKDVERMENASIKEALTLINIEEKSFYLSYDFCHNLTFADTNGIKLNLIIVDTKLEDFQIGKTYDLYCFSDKILKYEEK